jgi:hypothetical protein
LTANFWPMDTQRKIAATTMAAMIR